MDNEHKIPPTIDNQLEGMRNRHAADLRSEDLNEGSDDEDMGIAIDPISSVDGSPDDLSAVEQVQATWAPGAPETAFGAVPPENDDEIITAQSVRAERDPEGDSQDEDLEALDAHSSLDV